MTAPERAEAVSCVVAVISDTLALNEAAFAGQAGRLMVKSIDRREAKCNEEPSRSAGNTQAGSAAS